MEVKARLCNWYAKRKIILFSSCIYNRVCVVGKKEVIYRLSEELQLMQVNITDIVSQFEQQGSYIVG